ncbi:hypothetical protein [Streptomyces harbinensis]
MTSPSRRTWMLAAPVAALALTLVSTGGPAVADSVESVKSYEVKTFEIPEGVEDVEGFLARLEETEHLRANLSLEEKEYLWSGEPKVIEVNPATGEFLSVDPSPILPMATERRGCQRNVGLKRDACWETPAPGIDVGFYGSKGSVAGNWTNRSRFDSGDYAAEGCYNFLGAKCTGPLDHNTYVPFNPLVVATKAQIF